MFYVDVSIPQTEELFDGVIEELRHKTENFHFLGTYRASL
jgi:3-deoxy-7-phosphoheptulonate synthase